MTCLPAIEVLNRGAALPNGYWAWTRRRTVYAHRHVYEECFGPIPEGHQIHHICESRDCVNPEHMVAMTKFDHMQEHRSALCSRGLHPMEGNNLIRDPYPRCRECRNATQRKTHGAPTVGAQLAAGKPL